MAFWSSMAETLQAELIVEKSDSRNVAEVIADIANEKRITQIIIGQSAQTKWEEITKGSIINQLLHLIEGVDIHIVSARRERQKQDEDYEAGVKAYLIRDGNRLLLRLNSLVPDKIEGVFCRSVHTDFNTGVFKADDGGMKYLICDGIASTIDDGISKTFEARNYFALLVSFITSLTLQLLTLQTWVEVTAGTFAGFLLLLFLKRFTKGKQVGHIATVTRGKIELKGSELYVDGLLVG